MSVGGDIQMVKYEHCLDSESYRMSFMKMFFKYYIHVIIFVKNVNINSLNACQ